jgi:pyruvate kinase
MARTRILATLGLSNLTKEKIQALVEAGADALRINFSHGDDSQHRELLRMVQEISKETGRHVTTVADLQGPKIRLGALEPEVHNLAAMSEVRLVPGAGPTTPPRLPVVLDDLLEVTSVGQRILIGDGAVELTVTGKENGEVKARVVHGGTVSSHRGIYLPGAPLRTEALSEKDLHDLSVALTSGIDWVALSFVRSPKDIETARERIRHLSPGRPVYLIAKIERSEAVLASKEIIAAADAIMVARGDLGIETPLAELPLTQKTLINDANRAAKPCVVATQMLLSMVHSPRPSRAEVADVANAILDGADCLMLSEETAVGEYPSEAVACLREIAEATEPSIVEQHGTFLVNPPNTPALPHGEEGAVAVAAVRLSEQIKAKAIVVPTHSGRTARLVSRLRPRAPILVLTSQASTPAAVGLVWGVRCRAVPPKLSLEGLRDTARQVAREEFGLHTGDKIILTAGYPVEGRPTNIVTIAEI